ncbi:MAG: FmdB family zinc ribbon protein [Phycisphaerales bacterium]
MPIYEYVALEDQTIIEALRAMADADKPLPDPDGKGRTFVRKLSTFAAQGGGGGGGGGGSAGAARPSPSGGHRGGCACGKGGCGR